MKKYKLELDIVEPMLVFQEFSNFNLKVINFYILENKNNGQVINVITFEGYVKDLKKWYNEHYSAGEDFEWLLKTCGKVIRK